MQEKQLDHGNIDVKFPSFYMGVPVVMDVADLEYIHIGLVNERFILVNYELPEENSRAN